jgi:hypothetical protein
MLRMMKYALIALCLGTASTLMAQAPRPSVEIVLNPPTAQKGQTITADVYVRGAVNIAGTDIGMTVDPACLRIVERQPGEFLPTEAEAGGFSAFSEQHDHDTRLAASLLQRSYIANGDGIFFRTTLEVLCESGVAPLNVSFAELTGIEDLEAENAKFVTYTLADDTVEVIDAQLAISPVNGVFYGISPISNAILTITRPTFKWQAVPNTTAYTLQIDDDTDFNADWVVNQAVSTTTYTLPIVLPYGVYYWRVLPGSEAQPGALYRRLVISPPPLPAPLLVAPVHLAITGDTTPTLSWQAVASATAYEIEVDNHSTFATIPELSEQTSTVSIISGTLPGGVYYWRVRTLNSYGTPGVWSLTRRFTIDTVPPAIPAPLVPLDNATVAIKPAWRWSAVSTAMLYQLAVSHDPTCDEAESHTIKATLVPTYTAATPLVQGDYYWCVRAFDAVGNASPWSPPRRLTADLLLSPPPDGVLISLLPTLPVRLTWQALSGITSYTVQIDDEATFTDARTLIVQNATTVTVANPELSYGNYLWRVFPTGQTIAQPVVRRFSFTSAAALLPAPVLTAPAALARFNHTTPTVQWQPVNSAAGYQLQWSTSATFLANVTTLPVNNTSHTFASLAAGNGIIYYWRVRTLNSYGAPGAWSRTLNFTIDTVPPAIPTLLVPLDNARLMTGTRNIAFTWQPVSLAVRYELQIATDANFTVLVTTSLATTTTFSLPNSLALPNGIYYWRVRATDQVGNSSDYSVGRKMLVNLP